MKEDGNVRRRVQGPSGVATWVRVQPPAPRAAVSNQRGGCDSPSAIAALTGGMAALASDAAVGSGVDFAGSKPDIMRPCPSSAVRAGQGSTSAPAGAERCAEHGSCSDTWAARTQAACHAAAAVLASAQIDVQALAAMTHESTGMPPESSAAAGNAAAAVQAASAAQLPASDGASVDAASLGQAGPAGATAALAAGRTTSPAAPALSPDMAVRMSELLAGDDPQSDAAAEHKVATEVRARYSVKARRDLGPSRAACLSTGCTLFLRETVHIACAWPTSAASTMLDCRVCRLPVSMVFGHVLTHTLNVITRWVMRTNYLTVSCPDVGISQPIS